jgi:hypothetical protein
MALTNEEAVRLAEVCKSMLSVIQIEIQNNSQILGKNAVEAGGIMDIDGTNPLSIPLDAGQTASLNGRQNALRNKVQAVANLLNATLQTERGP